MKTRVKYEPDRKTPLEDSQGISVIQDRRRLPDRRKAKFELEDMKVISAKMVGN